MLAPACQGTHCGLGQPELVEKYHLNDPGVPVAQSYHSWELDAQGRRLDTQAYNTGTGSSYLNIDDATARNITAPVRL